MHCRCSWTNGTCDDVPLLGRTSFLHLAEHDCTSQWFSLKIRDFLRGVAKRLSSFDLPSLDCLEKARCTWNLVLIRLAGKVLPVPGEETERTELNSLPGFAETPSTTKCNFLMLGFPCSWDLQKTGSQSHYSMLLQSGIAYGKDKVRTTLVHPSLWVCGVFPFLWQQHVLLGHWWVHFGAVEMQAAFCAFFQF